MKNGTNTTAGTDNGTTKGTSTAAGTDNGTTGDANTTAGTNNGNTKGTNTAAGTNNGNTNGTGTNSGYVLLKWNGNKYQEINEGTVLNDLTGYEGNAVITNDLERDYREDTYHFLGEAMNL